MQPAVMAVNHPAFARLLNQQQNQRIVFHRQCHTAQTFPAWAWLVLMLLVIGRQRRQHFALPTGGHWRIQQTVTGLDKTRLLRELTQTVAAQLTSPRKIGQIHCAAIEMYCQRRRIIFRQRQRRQPLQIFGLTFPATRWIKRHHTSTRQRDARGDIA
ncbi:hypothetical protein D3C87_1459050 [compost metagenome]